MFRRNFLFGKDGGTANLIDVGSEDLYQPGKGYGFVTEKNRREQKLLQIWELNSSFDTMYWYQNEQLSFLKEDENGCYLDSAEKWQRWRHSQERRWRDHPGGSRYCSRWMCPGRAIIRLR